MSRHQPSRVSGRAPGEPVPAIQHPWLGLARRYWVFLLIGAMALLHGTILLVVRSAGSAPTAPVVHEVTLGQFEYLAPKNGAPNQRPSTSSELDAPSADWQLSDGRTASFELHVSVLDAATGLGQAMLQSRRHAVRQEVEQVLRIADPEAFADPQLIQLKRVLQERINAALGRRVVEEVIVTGLQLRTEPTPLGPRGAS